MLLLLLVIALPFGLSLLAALAQDALQRRLERDAPALPASAGAWVSERATVEVGLAPDDAGDGYWAGADFVALTERTWARRDPAGWAIGAHELGHAANTAAHPALDVALPVARLVDAWSGRAFAALLVLAALYGSPGVLAAAFAAAVVAALASAAVVADEAMASVHGHRLLAADPRLGPHLRTADLAMAGALSVYVAQLAGRSAILLAWPAVAALAAAPPLAPGPPSDLGVWAVVAAVPFLLLRTAQVLAQVAAPPRIESEFRLASLGQEEAGWDFLAGTCSLMLVAATYGLSTAPAYVAAVALAAVPAVGPAAALGRLPVLLPLLLVLRVLARRIPRERRPTWLQDELVPSTAPPASLLTFHSNPPLYLRASWLLRVSYLPLLVAVAAAL